jgi:putative transposase
MRYRRARAAGGTYFFTLNLADRSSHLLVERVDELRAAVRLVKLRHPFEALGWVVLPDHLHALWTLPTDEADFSTRWMLIKAAFSRSIEPGEIIRRSRLQKGERGIWQRRFWEHQIRDEDDLQRHLDYIQINPVKHGCVKRAVDWPYSSIHRYIRSGDLPEDWAAAPELDLSAGERTG